MFSLRVLFSFCLIFRQFQPSDAYKSVLIEKRVIETSNCKKFFTVNVDYKLKFNEHLDNT